MRLASVAGGDVSAAARASPFAASEQDLIPWRSVLDEIVRRRDSRRILTFASLLLAFAVVQAAYAVKIDSLGLLSDALHTLFHVGAIAISIFGSVYARRPASFAFSYGFHRFEILAAFSNSLFLIFVVLFVTAGALRRLMQPALWPDSSTLNLEFGIAGALLNAAGIYTLGPGASILDHLHRFQRGGRAAPLGADESNQRAILLNFASDLISSVAVIISSLLVRNGFALADTLQCFAVSALTLSLVVPLFTATAKILLQTAPRGEAGVLLDRCRRQLSVVDGVLEVHDEHYWLQEPGFAVASLALRVRADAAPNDTYIARAGSIFAGVVQDLTIQIERDDAAPRAPVSFDGSVDDDVPSVSSSHAHPQHCGHGHGATDALHAGNEHGHSHSGNHSHADSGNHGHSR